MFGRAGRKQQKERLARIAATQVRAPPFAREVAIADLRRPRCRDLRPCRPSQEVEKKAIGYGDIFTGRLYLGYPEEGLLEYANGVWYKGMFHHGIRHGQVSSYG